MFERLISSRRHAQWIIQETAHVAKEPGDPLYESAHGHAKRRKRTCKSRVRTPTPMEVRCESAAVVSVDGSHVEAAL